jgi:hypothetical protein
VEAEANAEVALKDLNFNRSIYLGEELKKIFVDRIEQDCKVPPSSCQWLD